MSLATAVVLMFVACDEPKEPVPSTNATPPPVATHGEEEAESPTIDEAPQDMGPVFGELLTERAFDENEVRGGLRRLASCAEYKSYVEDANIDFHLRRLFPEDYGRDFRVGARPRVGAPERAWAVDGTMAFLEYAGGFYLADAASRQAQVIENEMYKVPGLQNADLGYLFVGSSAWLAGPNDRGYLQFRNATQASGWGVYRGVRKSTYRQHQNTSIELYGPSESSVRFRHIMQMAGELLGVHVDTSSRSAYFALLTEPHADAKITTAGNEVQAGTRAQTEARLRSFPIRVPRKEMPRYSWQLNPRGGRTKSFSANVACTDYWIPNDPDTVGQRILVVHPFELERRKYGKPLAIMVEDDVRVAFGGTRLFIARRLHGRVWADGTMDRPLTELTVFELGDQPKIVATHQVEGVPVEILASRAGGLLITTRGESVERLTYPWVGEALVTEPRRHLPDLEVTVRGDVPGFVWETNLALEQELAFMLGGRVVAVRVVDNAAVFTTFVDDGTAVGTVRAENVFSIEPDELVVTGDAFILPIRGLTDVDALVGRFVGDELKLSPVNAPSGTALRAVADNTLLAIGSRRAVWLALDSGEELHSTEWDKLTPISAGRP